MEQSIWQDKEFLKEYNRAYRAANKEKIAKLKRRYYEANRENLIAASKEWSVQNREQSNTNKKNWAAKNQEAVKNARNKYKDKNKDLILEKARIAGRKNYQQNKMALRAKSLQYAKDNPEKARERRSTRRVRMANSKKYLITKKELVALYKKACYYCGSRQKIQLDHIIPLSKGGNHSIGNIVPACQSCNLTKQALFLIEWKVRHNLIGQKVNS